MQIPWYGVHPQSAAAVGVYYPQPYQWQSAAEPWFDSDLFWTNEFRHPELRFVGKIDAHGNWPHEYFATIETKQEEWWASFYADILNEAEKTTSLDEAATLTRDATRRIIMKIEEMRKGATREVLRKKGAEKMQKGKPAGSRGRRTIALYFTTIEKKLAEAEKRIKAGAQKERRTTGLAEYLEWGRRGILPHRFEDEIRGWREL